MVSTLFSRSAVAGQGLLMSGLIGAALLVGGAALPGPAAAQATASPKASAKSDAKKPPVRRVSQKKPAAAAPEPTIAAADARQLEAAREVMLGGSGCEFGQRIHLDESTRYPGYVDLSFNNRKYTMKPVLSSTGALRLEDVRAETLLIQIGNKTMLMNQKTGQRLVDNCVHPKQQTVAHLPAGNALLGEQAAK